MDKKKVLITGASGFLGHHFLKAYSTDYQIVGIYSETPIIGFKNISKHKFDFSNDFESNNFCDFIEKERPDFILNFAAVANANFCELNPESSSKINIDLPTTLAKICQNLRIKLIHTSTDLVFDGERGNYTERDQLNPISIYGKHKKEAEKLIQSNNSSALILRLPLLFGLTPRGTGFFQNWVEKLKSKETLFAFTDEFRTAAAANRVVAGIKLLIDKSASGIWHLGGKENCTRFEFATRLSTFLDIKNPNIKSSLRADVEMPAPRAKDVSLNSKKANSIGYAPLSLEEEFRIIFK